MADTLVDECWLSDDKDLKLTLVYRIIATSMIWMMMSRNLVGCTAAAMFEAI